MTDKEKIREFVEEIFKTNRERSSIEGYAAVTELRKVLAYIDSLPEEPVSEDLEEGTKETLNMKYGCKVTEGSDIWFTRQYEDMKTIHENRWWWGKSYDIILGGGVAIVELQMEDEFPLNAYVRDLSVVREERQKGWAKKLLTTCEEIARLNKKSYLYLCVAKENIWLTEFYKNQGFEVTHVDEHELQMTKYLSLKTI